MFSRTKKSSKSGESKPSFLPSFHPASPSPSPCRVSDSFQLRSTVWRRSIIPPSDVAIINNLLHSKRSHTQPNFCGVQKTAKHNGKRPRFSLSLFSQITITIIQNPGRAWGSVISKSSNLLTLVCAETGMPSSSNSKLIVAVHVRVVICDWTERNKLLQRLSGDQSDATS